MYLLKYLYDDLWKFINNSKEFTEVPKLSITNKYLEKTYYNKLNKNRIERVFLNNTFISNRV